jgi:hypothetical protein
MFTWFPNDAATAWLSQNAWLVLLAAIVIPAVIIKALRHGTNSDGWSDTSTCDHTPTCDGD